MSGNKPNTLTPAQKIPWLEPVLQDFKQVMENNKLPHALLIHGNRGIGKHYFGSKLAALVLCQSPEGHHPCDNCKSCSLRLANSHPDYHVLEPEEGHNQIIIEQIRELIMPGSKGISKLHSKATQASWNGNWKVVLLSLAESMNISAANSLLKVLEEPSDNTLFILLSHNLQLVLPTIRSRCQQLLLPLPTNTDANEWLQNQAIDAKVLEELGTQYSDQPLELMRLINDNLLEKRLAIKQLCKQMAVKGASVCEPAIALAKDKDYIVDYMHWFAEEAHAQIKSRVIDSTSQGLGLYAAVNKFFDIIQQHIREARYGSVNQRLFWETVFQQWQNVNSKLQ